MKPIQTQLIEWSPQALVLEATWNTPLPKPGDFLECHCPYGQVFFLVIDQVQLQAGHQAIRLQTTPTKGHPEFPLQQCHVLNGSEYLSRLRANTAGDEQSIQLGSLTLGLNQFGQWTSIHPQAKDILETMIQAFLDAEKYVIQIAPAPALKEEFAQTTSYKTHSIELGTQVSFSLQDIRSDRLVEALVSDLSESIRPDCSRFLHEQLSQLPDAGTLDDLIAAEAWKKFAYKNLLLEKLNTLSPYFASAKSPAKKASRKKSTYSKTALNLVELPNEAPELQAILYECALKHVRLENADVLILGSPELSEKAVRHTLGTTQAKVILLSENASPWAELADDVIQMTSDTTLMLYGHITGGVKVAVDLHVDLNTSAIVAEPLAPMYDSPKTDDINPFHSLLEESIV